MTSFSTSFWGNGNSSLIFSILFFCLLLLSTQSVWHLGRLAQKDRDWKILFNGANGVTLLSVILGWITIILYIVKKQRLDAVVLALQDYSASHSSSGDTAALQLHDTVQIMVGLMSTLRSFIAWSTLVFNMRAFVSLQFQPRLAVVIRTLIDSSSDMLHFMIIMLSTVSAFALSGMILFGKRLQDFAAHGVAKSC